MIESICKWLPKIIAFEDFKGNWDLYNNELYKMFIYDFITNPLYFNNKEVKVRTNPKQNNYEHAFIHLTYESMKDGINVNDRIPDFRRGERISWNRKIIESYPCIYNCNNCQKVLYFEEYYKNTQVLLYYSMMLI